MLFYKEFPLHGLTPEELIDAFSKDSGEPLSVITTASGKIKESCDRVVVGASKIFDHFLSDMCYISSEFIFEIIPVHRGEECALMAIVEVDLEEPALIEEGFLVAEGDGNGWTALKKEEQNHVGENF